MKQLIKPYNIIQMALAAACFVVCFSAGAVTNKLPVNACIFTQDGSLTKSHRSVIAQCLGWQPTDSPSICKGSYRSYPMTPLMTTDEVRVSADNVSLVAQGKSALHGHVEVHETERIVNAQTAYIYRDDHSGEITKIELLGDVQYREPDRVMIAKKATIDPRTKAGQIEELIYRFDTHKPNAPLPAWGRARWAERFANEDYLLKKATYTTCAPQNNAWQIDANELTLNHAKATGVAKGAVLRVAGMPIFYAPYLSFPTTNARKSGFLTPLVGYSNVGGFDLALPYYWNIAPNYDATITPHVYTLRGLMMGGDFRFLTQKSTGVVSANVLPKDQAFQNFINQNEDMYPSLSGASTDRWSFLVKEHTQFSNDLQMNINFQQVSDDYYLQDFSNNLGVLTENQLAREGDVSYLTDHWLFRGMVQNYQTLHPITQSNVASIYQRLPQLLANTSYHELPLHANLDMLSQYDNFRWPDNTPMQPLGPRYHWSPKLSFPYTRSWGHITPALALEENYYDVQYMGNNTNASFNRSIPEYSVDSGLSFERSLAIRGRPYTQLLEPRLYYLNVAYHDQTPVPVYDSAYMIFTSDQLFRNNRFSGFDRIGDANQLAYALTSRWMSDDSGLEKVSITVGQIRYFQNRRVLLCYQQDGPCVENPLTLGYLSPTADSSPIASRATYQLNPNWVASGDYVWDPETHATNNGNLNLHYQPTPNQVLSVGYTYLVSGNVLQMPLAGVQNKPLHQATIGYAMPFNEHWSGIGAYSHNVSDNYSMMSLLGMQYDTCCWAMRFMGGRTFQSIEQATFTPQYNNNVYFQVLLKGLGSVGTSNPASMINTYLPGYQSIF